MHPSRIRAGIALVVALAIGGVVAIARHDSSDGSHPAHVAIDVQPTSSTSEATTAPRTTTTSIAPATTTSTTRPHKPADDFVLTRVHTVTGRISPKSVVATDTGLVFAQNMMYQHTMTVYDAGSSALVKTVPDAVDLARFGFKGHPGVSRGAPVEAAVDHAHKYMFATNYSMYGANFGPEGSDNCTGPVGLSPSYVYRVNLKTLAIDAVGQVGMVPKYVAVTPDDKFVLVTNWCSYDLSVLDYNTLHEVRRIHLGAYPRGIAVDGTRHVAYIAVMGSFDVARVDLPSFGLTYFRGVGNSPRHLVLSNDGTRLFVTLNGDNRVVAVDTSTGHVVTRTATGSQPRSMAISSDGLALYVVNYMSNTVSVLKTADLSVVNTFSVPDHPIGVAYEPTRHRVWVACYSGAILVYDA
ncbi:MAG TPA: YncE family protein [Acidimicrobiia bacterium]|nr:YncE family protein [Acidimicrobiia bacterium]